MSNFDAILTSTPLNSTAAKVTARGEHWVPRTPLPAGLEHWKARPLVKPYVANPQDRQAPDLTGKRFGRFTVIGVLDDSGAGKNRGLRWVCQCACGDYEAKKSRAIRSALAGLSPIESPGFRCFYCAQWQIAQARYKKHGSKPLESFLGNQEKTVQAAQTPEGIIVGKIANISESDCASVALEIVAAINRAGFRIVRDHREVEE